MKASSLIDARSKYFVTFLKRCPVWGRNGLTTRKHSLFQSVQEEGRNDNRLKKIMQITSNTEVVNPKKSGQLWNNFNFLLWTFNFRSLTSRQHIGPFHR